MMNQMILYIDPAVVFQRLGMDVAIFVTAALAYLILQHMKVKHQATKAAFKQASVNAEQESVLIESINETSRVQITAEACVAESKVIKPHLLHEEENEVPGVDKQLQMMQMYAKAHNIKETLRIFREIEANGKPLTSNMYNAVLLAWVKCGNVWAAENWMDEIKEAGMVDEGSFNLLVKALVNVRDLEKAHALLHDMKEVGLSPSIGIFDELLIGFARGGFFDSGIALLKEMDAAGVDPSPRTFHVVVKLVNSARQINQRCASMQDVLAKYCVDEGHVWSQGQIPCLAAAITQAGKTALTGCVDDVEITGSLTQVEALRSTLEQNGCEDNWPFSRKAMTAFSKSMTMAMPDKVQDSAYRARATATFKCVSRQGLRLPFMLESTILQYLGHDLYSVRFHFENNDAVHDICEFISQRHPHVGIRHCWVKPKFGSCGQRTIVNGEEEEDDACFERHIEAVRIE